MSKKKEVKIVSFSIVIVGTGFSPNNYDGNWLADKEIIPPNWNWKVSNSVVTPVVSQIVYEMGKVNLKIEKNKITISDNLIENNKIESSKIAEIAKRFIQRHKHLTFSALGINFESVVLLETDNKYLKLNFLKDKKLKVGEEEVDNVSITLTYPLKNGGLVNFVLNEGTLSLQTEKDRFDHKGVVCSANFHREFASDSESSLIISQLNYIKDDKQKLVNILQSIID